MASQPSDRSVVAVAADREQTGTASRADPGVIGVRFRMLGHLAAESDAGVLALGGPAEHKLLAALLLDANRVVPVTSLVDVLWDADPPATASKLVRNGVSRLRLALAAGGAAGPISTHVGGYRLAVEDGALDARLFEHGVGQARRAAAAGQVPRAVQLLRSALGLWRGRALAGLSGCVVEAAAVAWEERRCAAIDLCYDYQLALGRHREVVAELTALAAQYPLRDTTTRQVMLALYRCGRRADALAWYDRARAVLGDLGLDPGMELRRLRQQILTDDPVIAPGALAGDPSALAHRLPRTRGGNPVRRCGFPAGPASSPRSPAC
jgi:DNA-binding SARP family transcriptional activator